jgi:hypothetical protein
VHVAFGDVLLAARDACVPILRDIRARLAERITEYLGNRQQFEREATLAMAGVRQRQARLIEAYLAGHIDESDYTKRRDELKRAQDSAEAAAHASTGSAVELEGAVDECLGALTNPIRLWERCTWANRRRLAEVFFGAGLTLGRDGAVKPTPGAGLTGIIEASAVVETRMAYPAQLWANLLASARELKLIAA